METITINPKIEQELDAEIEEALSPTRILMLYNDDVNTFVHVINCLMLYCLHSKEQAEQIAIIVHQNGKCDIKHGSFKLLKPIYEVLLEYHLSVKIE